jgi:hypothetical protein
MTHTTGIISYWPATGPVATRPVALPRSWSQGGKELVRHGRVWVTSSSNAILIVLTIQNKQVSGEWNPIYNATSWAAIVFGYGRARHPIGRLSE